MTVAVNQVCQYYKLETGESVPYGATTTATQILGLDQPSQHLAMDFGIMLKKQIAVCLFLFYLVSTSATASALFTDSHPSDVIPSPADSPLVALVIGNAGYKHQPLHAPLNDARAISGLLRDAGYDIIQIENATRTQIVSALAEMKRRLGDSGTGLFYFAGHGVQTGDSRFVLPIKADISSADAVVGTSVSLDHIVQQMSDRRADGINLIIVDACLNNPYQQAVTNKATAETALSTRAMLPDRTLIAFSTANGAEAYEDDSGQGVYTRQLVHVLSAQGRDAKDVFDRVRSAVSTRTASRQIPWTLSTLPDHYQLPDRATKAGPGSPPLSTPIPENRLLVLKTRGILPKDGDAQYELEFWQSIKNSTDAADYEAYLEAYPDGKFAPLARSRAARYKKAAPASEPPPAVTIKAMDDEYKLVRNANFREAPSPRSKVIKKLQKGMKIHVTGRVKDENWFQVEISGTKGYIFKDLLQPPPAPVAKQPPKPKPQPVVKTPKPPVKVAPPVAVKKFELTRDCPTCPEMITLPAGEFTMGDDRGDRSEKPARRVSIKQAFAIGKYEVTVSQWNACHEAGGCTFKPKLDGTSGNTPMRDVSWSDAQQYVKWLSKSTGKNYRLPTEAEWEYAARAGTQSRFWWGDDAHQGRADCKKCDSSWDRKTPAEVDTFPANAFGLHNTSGGVWEWVEDCWFKSHKGAPLNGSSRSRPDCREHVIRGGAWRNDESYMHSASRFKYDSSVRYLLNGFRVARTLK